MEVRASERRVSRRLQVKTALQVRIWKSGSTERNAESENLSERGAFFATDAPLAIGSAVEILETMPEEITGKPSGDARDTWCVSNRSKLPGASSVLAYSLIATKFCGQNPEDNMQRRGLIVDDEQVVCELIGKVLHSAGMEALTLTRSSEAPEILDEGKFDMVFLDLHMASPDVSMSGILVRASRVVPVGSSLRMSLQLSQRMRPIMASGSVVRILGGNQMGIQLHQLTVPGSERL